MFDWDAANSAKLRQRHNSPGTEAEEIFADPSVVGLSGGWIDGEYREDIIGIRKGGRLLTVVYVERDGRIRILSARPSTRREEAIYRRGYP